MPRPLLLIIALTGLFVARPCRAQIEINPAMRGALSLVQLEVKSGKLQARPRRAGRTGSNWSSSNAKRTERLQVQLTGAAAQIQYTMTSPTQRVTLSASSEFGFHVRQEPLGNSTVIPIDFKQVEGASLTLRWTEGNSLHELEATNLWHLCLQEPELCRNHLFPLLEILRPGWRLAETADQIAAALVTEGVMKEPIPWKRWRALVADLGADSFAVRQTADWQLREEGPAVQTFLENYDRRQLDAEQRHRITNIIRSLSTRTDNVSPSAIAIWLAADPRTWLALLSDDELQRRELAKQQLQRLMEGPVEFECEADPETRKAQIEKLRSRVKQTLTVREPTGAAN